MEAVGHDPRRATLTDPRHGKLNVEGKKLIDYSPWDAVLSLSNLSGSIASVLSGEQAVTSPLFTKSPSSEDVAQGGIGDCAYLAAILAILNLDEGPLIVMHMMRDLPAFGTSADFGVVVRLFDFSKQPYYLKLPRTIITSWLPETIAPEFHAGMLAKMGVWPIFLEKALTAFDDEGCFAPLAASYTRINGATGNRAFKLLLGVDAKREEIPRQQTQWVEQKNDSPLNKLHLLLHGALDPFIDRALLAQIFPGNTARMYAVWQVWLRLHPGFHSELQAFFEARTGQTVKVPGMLPFSSITTDAGKVFNAQHLSDFITRYHQRDFVPLAPAETPAVIAAIVGYARTLQALPGKRGTGDYAQFQIDFFNRLKALHLAQIPVVVSTDGRYIGTSTRNDTGHSGGEAKVKGLASRHAYAVLDVFETGGKRVIRIGNPWGRYGRAYLWQVLQGTGGTISEAGQSKFQARLLEASGNVGGLSPSMTIEVEEGVFDLDLYDLTKRFRWVDYCMAPPTLGMYRG